MAGNQVMRSDGAAAGQVIRLAIANESLTTPTVATTLTMTGAAPIYFRDDGASISSPLTGDIAISATSDVAIDTGASVSILANTTVTIDTLNGIHLGTSAGGPVIYGTSYATLTGNNQTLDTTRSVLLVTAVGARTGVILEAGTTIGQVFHLVAIDGDVNSITFNAADATARVANASSRTITTKTMLHFIWSGALWY